MKLKSLSIYVVKLKVENEKFELKILSLKKGLEKKESWKKVLKKTSFEKNKF